MATSITFTDGTGAVTLTNGMPDGSGADRFSAWTPNPLPSFVGDSQEALADGTLHVFSFRNEYTVSFELRDMPKSKMSDMIRFKRHIEKGGTCTVNTGDSGTRSYPTCCGVKGQPITISPTNGRPFRYTVFVMLRNIAASPVDFICIY